MSLSVCDYNWRMERELLSYARDYAQTIFRELRQGEYVVYNLAFRDLEYSISARDSFICVQMYHKGLTVLNAYLDRSSEGRHTALWQVRYYCHGDWWMDHERFFRKVARAAVDSLRMRKWDLQEAWDELDEADRVRRACFQETREKAEEIYREARERYDKLVDWLRSLPDMQAAVDFEPDADPENDRPTVRWCCVHTGEDGELDPFTNEVVVRDTELERDLRKRGGDSEGDDDYCDEYHGEREPEPGDGTGVECDGGSNTCGEAGENGGGK